MKDTIENKSLIFYIMLSIALCVQSINTSQKSDTDMASTDDLQPLLLIEKGKTLGLKLSLPQHLQKPLSPSGMLTKDMIKLLLKNSVSLIKQTQEVRNNRFAKISAGEIIDENSDAAQYPFVRFDVCQCMPQYPVYHSFAEQVTRRAAALYQQKNSTEPFVYGSFASGGLFPDLYILTQLVQLLRSKNVKDIHLRVNLIDTDLRDYISQSSQGLGRGSFAPPAGTGEPVHAHMLFFNPSARITFSNTDNATALIIDFLTWFTQNLNIKLDLYIYGTAQDYVFDNQQGRAPNHDLLVAVDYYPEAVGDLAQLALRTTKLGGYLCSLNNKTPEEVTHIPGLLPHSYKEVAELALKEAELEKRKEEALMQGTQDLESLPSEDKEDTAHIVISKKIASIAPETFKKLLQRARGDNTKIGRLFNALVYPQSKIVKYISQKESLNLKFNPFDYFEIEYKTTLTYELPWLSGTNTMVNE